LSEKIELLLIASGEVHFEKIVIILKEILPNYKPNQIQTSSTKTNYNQYDDIKYQA
jgi:hypothetical protein